MIYLLSVGSYDPGVCDKNSKNMLTQKNVCVNIKDVGAVADSGMNLEN